MKKYILLIFLPFLLISIKSNAQASLGISPYSISIPMDTLPAGASDSISFWVINRGTSTFNGNIDIYTIVQDSAAFFFHAIDTTAFGSHTIAAGDSSLFYLNMVYNVGPLKFHYDINVIVIWPVALTASIADSLTYIEFITLPNGINEFSLDNIIKAYPNPTLSNFTLESCGKNAIEDVRIFDSQGRMIETIKKPTAICTEKWAPGIYILTIQLENKQMRTIRVIKQ